MLTGCFAISMSCLAGVGSARTTRLHDDAARRSVGPVESNPCKVVIDLQHALYGHDEPERYAKQEIGLKALKWPSARWMA
jgi:hypothetical protein